MAKKCMAYDVKKKKKVPVPCKGTSASTAEQAAGVFGGLTGRAVEAIRKRKKKQAQYMP